MKNKLTSKCFVRIHAIRIDRTPLELTQMEFVGMQLINFWERVGSTELVEDKVRGILWRNGLHRAQKR